MLQAGKGRDEGEAPPVSLILAPGLKAQPLPELSYPSREQTHPLSW